MAGENEVEHARRHLVEDLRKMTEKDANVRVRIREQPRFGALAAIGTRIDADDLDATSADVHCFRFVDEQPRRLEITQTGRARKRIAAVLDVVIAEHDVTARKRR